MNAAVNTIQSTWCSLGIKVLGVAMEEDPKLPRFAAARFQLKSMN